MGKNSTIWMMILFYLTTNVSAQNSGPYLLKMSKRYDPPGRFEAGNIIEDGKGGIIQINTFEGKQFSFQQFSSGLKLEKEISIDMKDKIQNVTHFERMVALKTKKYVFLRDVRKDANTEGITALEFIPSNLELSFVPVPLFQSSFKVINERDLNRQNKTYEFFISEDKSKFLYKYTLVPKVKSNSTSKKMIGLHVFDENLQKIWGGEFEMPYTENRMKITDCKFTFDGSVYLLIKVLKENTVDLIGNYHYEVLTFQKNNTDQKPIVLNVGQYTPITAFLYEDEAHEVHVVNTYAKQHEGKTIYDVANGICFGKIVGNEYVPDPLKPGFYEIPLDAISQGASEKEMKMLKKDPDRIGIENLNIRNVYRMPDGSTKIIAEDYDIGYSGTTDLSSHPVTFARDVVIFSIDVNGKLEWVRVVPKNQVWGDGTGIGASLNSISKENTLHLFFVDTNNQGTPDYVHSNDIGAKFYIIAVTILPNGEIKRYSLGQIKGDKYYLMLRKFEKMGDDNLMGNSYRDNDNKLFSIKIE